MMLTVTSVPMTGMVPQNFEISRRLWGPGISSNDTDRLSDMALGNDLGKSGIKKGFVSTALDTVFMSGFTSF